MVAAACSGNAGEAIVRKVSVLLSTLFLAGCNGALGTSQDSKFIDPGEWEIVNGVPGYEATYKRCFSAADIAKPNLGVLNFDNPGCSKDRFTVTGGKISFTSACAIPSESSDGIRMRGDGRYDAKSFEIAVRRQGNPDAAIRGTWLGECQASDQS